MGRPYVLGLDCALYYMPDAIRVAATLEPPAPAKPVNPFAAIDFSTGDFLEIAYCRDLTLNMSGNMADLTSRASNGWSQNVRALKQASIDFQILWRPDDAEFVELQKRYIDGCPMCFCVLDGAVIWNGESTIADASTCVEITPYVVTGLYADYAISNFTRGEPLEEGLTADITIQPTVGMIYPQFVGITSASETVIY